MQPILKDLEHFFLVKQRLFKNTNKYLAFLESSRLEKTFKVIQSNPLPRTTTVTPKLLNHITQNQILTKV